MIKTSWFDKLTWYVFVLRSANFHGTVCACVCVCVLRMHESNSFYSKTPDLAQNDLLLWRTKLKLKEAALHLHNW